MTLKFSEKFDHPFSHVFFLYLVSCFLSVTVSLQCRLQAVSMMHVTIYPFVIIEERRNRIDLVTGTPTKPYLSGNMLPNINTCENGWSNFSENLRIARVNSIRITKSIKLL